VARHNTSKIGNAINSHLALSFMFITRAPGIQFQVGGVGKLWRGTRSSLSGLELVFGCAANSRCRFVQKCLSAATKTAYISEIRRNTRYIAKGTESVSLLALQPHRFASAAFCCYKLHDMRNFKGMASNGRTLRQRFANICWVVPNSSLIAPDSSTIS